MNNGGWKTILSYWGPVTFQGRAVVSYLEVSRKKNSFSNPSDLGTRLQGRYIYIMFTRKVYTYTYIRITTYKYIYIYIYIYVYMHVYTHVNIYIYILHIYVNPKMKSPNLPNEKSVHFFCKDVTCHTPNVFQYYTMYASISYGIGSDVYRYSFFGFI